MEGTDLNFQVTIDFNHSYNKKKDAGFFNLFCQIFYTLLSAVFLCSISAIQSLSVESYCFGVCVVFIYCLESS